MYYAIHRKVNSGHKGYIWNGIFANFGGRLHLNELSPPDRLTWMQNMT
jgi:hypothetical protein